MNAESRREVDLLIERAVVLPMTGPEDLLLDMHLFGAFARGLVNDLSFTRWADELCLGAMELAERYDVGLATHSNVDRMDEGQLVRAVQKEARRFVALAREWDEQHREAALEAAGRIELAPV